MKQITVHCDGCCKGNPGMGGWGAILEYKEHRREICGGEVKSTNQRMELQAAIESLLALKEPCIVELYSDSQYLIKGMNEWLKNWKVKGWKTSNGLVKNKDQLFPLDGLNKVHTVKWNWVKGHAGNEAADILANQGINTILRTL